MKIVMLIKSKLFWQSLIAVVYTLLCLTVIAELTWNESEKWAEEGTPFCQLPPDPDPTSEFGIAFGVVGVAAILALAFFWRGRPFLISAVAIAAFTAFKAVRPMFC